MNMNSYMTIIKRHGAVIFFIFAACIYGLSAGLKINRQSRTPQYVFLANSFLHGHLDLTSTPESKFDLIEYEGRWFVPGGMGPALILMPVVSIFGTGVSDVFFGVILGSINVSLIFLLLSALDVDFVVNIWLTVLFAFGTVHWWVSSVGSVWFNAQLVALSCMILHVLATLKDRPLLAGSFLGGAMLSRPTTLFSIPFFLLMTYKRENSFTRSVARLIPFAAMVAGAVSLMLAYNYLRFGAPLEFGYGYVQGTKALTDAFARGGGFSLRYFLCNFYVSILGLPNIAWNPLPGVNAACPHLEPVIHDFTGLSSFFNPLGMSIFITSPAFFLIFKGKSKDPLVPSAWAGMLGTLLVLWMYHSTGWVQFGYRYTLDFIVFIFILLSKAVTQIRNLERILIGLSVVMGATGVYLMYYMTFGLVWPEMFLEMMKKFYWMIF